MSADFGGRGGAAEDAELLAELMAISNRSSGKRFDDETTTTDAITSGGNGPGNLDASQTAAEPASTNESEEAVNFASGSDGGVEESGRLRSEADEMEGSTAIATAAVQTTTTDEVAAGEDDGGEPAE
ncbi:hypothetical protein THAOC_17898, partial [Thalassiosira oceanica]